MLPIVKGRNKHAKIVKSRAPFVYEGRSSNYGGVATIRGGDPIARL